MSAIFAIVGIEIVPRFSAIRASIIPDFIGIIGFIKLCALNASGYGDNAIAGNHQGGGNHLA